MSRKIKTLTKEECSLLIDSFSNPRDRTIALLMLDAGLRVSEVAQLTIGDMFFNGEPVRSITIRREICKTKVERTVPLSPRLQESIQIYQFKIRNATVLLSDRFVFCGRSGEDHISVRQIQRLIGSHAQSVLGRWIHPHVLRHTFATRLAGMIDLKGVQELLGHKRLTSTEIYLHSNADDVKKAVDRLGSL